jgi:hypothetical protein
LIFTFFIFVFSLKAILNTIKNKRGAENIEILTYGFLCLLLFHFASAKELQIFRGIFYLLPVYFLIPIIGVVHFTKNIYFKFSIYITMIVSILTMYPKNFFKEPTIPRESIYIGSNLYENVKQNCKEKLIISSQYPYILNLYNIKADYYIQENIMQDIQNGSIIHSNGRLMLYNDATLMITNLNDLKNIVSNKKQICYIERTPVIRLWLNKETINYINLNFERVFSDVNQSLYFFKTTKQIYSTN